MEALQDCQEAASRMDDGGADEAAQPSSKRQKAEGGLGYIPVGARSGGLAGVRGCMAVPPCRLRGAAAWWQGWRPPLEEWPDAS